VVEVALDDALERALERNLDIAVERLNPQMFDFQLAALDANYRPTFTTNFGMNSRTSFARSQTAGEAAASPSRSTTTGRRNRTRSPSATPRSTPT
jgi:hypothetical protein